MLPITFLADSCSRARQQFPFASSQRVCNPGPSTRSVNQDTCQKRWSFLPSILTSVISSSTLFVLTLASYSCILKQIRELTQKANQKKYEISLQLDQSSVWFIKQPHKLSARTKGQVEMSATGKRMEFSFRRQPELRQNISGPIPCWNQELCEPWPLSHLFRTLRVPIFCLCASLTTLPGIHVEPCNTKLKILSEAKI